MDPISTTASILTFVGAIQLAATAFSDFKRGPHRLCDLATQLDLLKATTTQLTALVRSCGIDDPGSNTLVSIQMRLDSIQATVDKRVLCKASADRMKGFNRLKYITQDKEIRKQLAALDTIRSELHTTMLLLNLKVAMQQGCTAYTELSHRALERSSNFYPKTYITEQPLQQHLMVCFMVELHRSETLTTHKYYLLFLMKRRWRRVTVTAMASKALRQSRVSATKFEGYKTLPSTIQPQLIDLLQEETLYNTITNIRVELDMDRRDSITLKHGSDVISEDLAEVSAIDTSKHVQALRCRNLIRYTDREVITLGREAMFFVVKIGSNTCIEHRIAFGNDAAFSNRSSESFIKSMNHLLSLQGCAGIAKFQGIVLQENRLQSYLIQAPRQGRLLAAMQTAQDERAPVTWERRARWFRQFLSITAEVHRRGMVVGWEPESHSWIWVNAEDDIEVVKLSSRAEKTPNKCGYLPPEIRKLMHPTDFSISYDISFEADIFNLGYMLWLLAQYTGPYVAMFCRGRPCEIQNGWCALNADHTNPIALPSCSDSLNYATSYVDTIIGHCRQEQPVHRKPIGELINLLPPELPQRPFSLPPEVLDPWRSMHRYSENMRCDKCGKHTPQEHCRCNVCGDGDFDLCAQCFHTGFRCFDDSHVMVRRVSRNRQFVNEPLEAEVSLDG